MFWGQVAETFLVLLSLMLLLSDGCCLINDDVVYRCIGFLVDACYDCYAW